MLHSTSEVPVLAQSKIVTEVRNEVEISSEYSPDQSTFVQPVLVQPSRPASIQNVIPSKIKHVTFIINLFFNNKKFRKNLLMEKKKQVRIKLIILQLKFNRCM